MDYGSERLASCSCPGGPHQPRNSSMGARTSGTEGGKLGEILVNQLILTEDQIAGDACRARKVWSTSVSRATRSIAPP